MLQQQGFNLGRSYTEAFELDHLLFAISDRDIPFFVKPANIPRIEPAIAQRFGGRFGSLPIALHDLWSLDQDFPLFPDAQFDLAGLDIDDFQLGIIGCKTRCLDLDEPLIVDRLEGCDWP